MIGRTISHYEITEKLGEGGMGVVYKARDSRLKRFVALKVLPPEKVADAERKQRFVQEAQSASALNHPNIVTVYDIGQSEGVDFIAMEHVEGKTLGELIGRKGLELNEALKVAIQIADALARAHAAGIVHRDLKPGNVMVTPDGRVKVLDFGLAKLTEAGPVDREAPTVALDERPPTESGLIVGTVSYMSPEQAEGKKVDARSDIFSFGSVLYEMLTGQRAFRRDSQALTLAAVLHLEPPALPEGTPAELERIVARCLRKDPARRFQTAADLKVALEELKEESDSGKLTGIPAAAPKRPRRWAIGAAAALMLAAVAVWRLWEEAPPSGLHAVPLTSYSGVASPPSLSPDGSKVTFGWNGEKQDEWHIYVMRIGGSSAPVRRTTDPAWEGFPAWSPDDRWIAFERRQQNGNLAILLVPPEGGSERKVTEIATSSFLSWTPDAKWLAFVAPEPPQHGPYSIWAVNIDTFERRRLTKFVPQSAGATGDHFPSISPDGSALAFARVVKSFVADLYVQRLTRDLQPKGDPKGITDSHYMNVLGTAWTADSREIVYGAGRGSSLNLWRVPASGGRAPERLTYAAQSAYLPVVSGPARRLVYNWAVSSSNLWRLDIRTGEQKMLIGSTQGQYNAQYSPDGRRIAFSSTRSGNNDVWSCDAADGSNCQQITDCGSECGTPRWSPDSAWLALDSRVEGQSEIYVVAADGGKLRRITNGPSGAMIPSWSHDGLWIYFVSERGGQFEIWKAPKGGGEPVQVTRAGGYGAFESPDGKYLYYVKHLQAGLFRMPAQGGEETPILPAPPAGDVNNRAFGVTSKGVYFYADGKTIQFLDAATGKISTLAVLDQALRALGELTVSQDDAYVVYPLVGQNSTNLMLVEGFR